MGDQSHLPQVGKSMLEQIERDKPTIMYTSKNSSRSSTLLRDSFTSQATGATSPCSFGGSSGWGGGAEMDGSLRESSRSSRSRGHCNSFKKEKKSNDKEEGKRNKEKKSKRKSACTPSPLILSGDAARVTEAYAKAAFSAECEELYETAASVVDGVWERDHQWLEEESVSTTSFTKKSTPKVTSLSENLFENQTHPIQTFNTGSSSVWENDDIRWDDEECNPPPKISNVNQTPSIQSMPSLLPTHQEDYTTSRISSSEVSNENTKTASDSDSETRQQPSHQHQEEQSQWEYPQRLSSSANLDCDLPRCSSLVVEKRPVRHILSLATRILITIAVGIAVGVAIGIGVYFTSADKDENENIATPDKEASFKSMSPSSAPTFISSDILLAASHLSGFDVFTNTTSPQFQAIGWMSSVDQIDTAGQMFAQRYALVVAYFSFQGADWINQEQWLRADLHECDWSTGIVCESDETGHVLVVKGFDATRNNLQGTIPFEIGLLTSSETFLIPKNNVQGIIPEAIGNMTSLSVVDLSDNQIMGAIPTTIENVNDLIMLDLSKNQLSSTLPDALYNLQFLRTLVLKENKISGNLAESVQNLTSMVTLDLRNNQLSGQIPINLDKLTKLDIFFADHNRFSGTLPLTSATITVRQIFSFSHNQLTGNIEPDATYGASLIGAEFRLQYVDASYNLFSGSISPLIGFMPTLRHLDFSGNDFFGPFPIGFGWSEIEFLAAANNELTGAVPTGNPSLTHLDVSNNLLTEGIPDELCDYPHLDTLLLSGNSLQSTIPSCLAKSQQLCHLELRDCDLIGPIPSELDQLSDLLILDLSSNSLTSTIPSELGDLTRLEHLDLQDNLLAGSIPSQLANMLELKTLDLMDNGLIGTLPVEFEGLEKLESLSLQGNGGMGGEIPLGLCGMSRLELLFHDIGCNIACECCNDFEVTCGFY